MRNRITAGMAMGIGCVLLFGAYALAMAQGHDQAKQQGSTPKNTSKQSQTHLYMRAKLANSQKVLEGLVTEDFDLIRKGAKQMKEIAEAAHWPTTIDEVYQHHSVLFRRQCDKLTEQADRGDLQAAHYTYLHMSTTCIDCHNYVRRRFRVERKKPDGPIQLIPSQWKGMENQKPPQPDDDKSG